MSDEKAHVVGETTSSTGRSVMEEVGSLRSELAEIRDLLSRGHNLERAIEEYRYLPLDVKNPFRWGFMGVWGKGGRSSCYSINTTTEEGFFDDPDSHPAHVAELATVFANPQTVSVCVHLFRNGGNTREELQQGCKLNSEDLEEAIRPLLEWRFVTWKDNRLVHKGPDLNGQGVHYAITLVGITKAAFAFKDRQEHK